MPQFLVFRLYAPLSAWGTVAVGEVRPSSSHPTRSGVMGLLSAALGIRRTDARESEKLSRSLDFGVLEVSTGSQLIDYHSVQAPDRVGPFVYRTRRDSIVVGADRLGTILSRREYRCDGLWIVAVWSRMGCIVDLQQLLDALRHPRFNLYAGRKSCPLGLPLYPQLVDSPGLRAAFSQAVFPPVPAARKKGGTQQDLIGTSAHRRIYWEGDAGDLKPEEVVERYDSRVSGERRQFRPRMENVATWIKED